MGKSTWDVAALLTQMTQHRIDYTQDIMASKHCTIGVIRAPFDVGTRNMMLITDISARRQDLVHGSLCSLP